MATPGSVSHPFTGNGLPNATQHQAVPSAGETAITDPLSGCPPVRACGTEHKQIRAFLIA